MDSVERSYKSQGLIGSLVFHALLLALFFFFVLNTPDPPLTTGGSGIELNYGTVDGGSGEIQTMNDASPELLKEESAPANPEEIAASDPTEAPVPEQVEEDKMMTSEDPEDAHIEVKKETRVIEKPVVPVTIEKPIAKENREEAVEKKQEPIHLSANGKTGTVQKTGGNNNGDREGKIGDQGNPQGSLKAEALYGNLGEGGEGPGGTGGGNKLDLTGWKLAFRLEKKDVTNENGKIVYQIKVDDKGDLVSIIPVEKTVSPAVEKFYRQQIEDNWAVDRSKDNTNPPPIATGKYTVFVRSK
jgi:protein TonB